MKVSLQWQAFGSVEGCPRCGSDHELLYFRPLTGSNELWAECEETNQPVVVAVENADDQGVGDLLGIRLERLREEKAGESA